MSTSVLIYIVLFALIVATLPNWKYAKLWGRSYTPGIFLGLIVAAHTFTLLTAK
jgi:uncharacterized membrane protein (DUF485 family)